MTAARSQPIVRSLVLSPDLSEVSRGRVLIAEVASAAGFAEGRVFDITVACSEAIANAIEHAPIKGEVNLRTILHEDRLEVEVQGPGEFQAPDRLKKRESRGLGLPLMAKLSDHVALYSGPKGGTFVGLTFYLPGSSIPEDDPVPPSVRELLEENELTAAITQAAPVGLYVLDPDLRFRWTNPAYREFLEEPFRSQSLDGVSIGEAVPGSEEGGALDILLRVSRTGEPAFLPEYEYRGFARGTTYWRWEILPLREEHPDPPFDVLVVISEITQQVAQRRKVEALGREAAERAEWLTRLIDSMTDEVWIADRDGRLTLTNPSASAEFGISGTDDTALEELLGQLEVYRPDMTPRPHEEAQPLRALAGEVINGEEEIVRTPRTGQLRTRVVSAAPIRGADGTIIGSVSVVRDTTEHKQAERAVVESEEQLRSVFDTSRDVIYRVDLQAGRYDFISPSVQTVLGYSPEEILAEATKPVILVHPDDLVSYEAAIAECREKGCAEVEYRQRTKAGSYRWVSNRMTEVTDEEGRPQYRTGSLRDITERKRVEERLARHHSTLTGINRIYEAALSTASEMELGEVCLEVAEALTESKFGFIGELGSNGRLYDIAISDPGWDLCRVESPRGHRKPPGDLKVHGIYGRVLVDGKGLFTNDPSTHPDRIGLPPGHPPLTAFLGVPLLKDGRVMGMVAVGNREGGYAPEQQQTLEELTPSMVAAFSRKRGEEALRQSEERFRALTENLDWGVALVDEHGRFSIVNRSFLRLFDLPEDADILNVNSRDWSRWRVFDEAGRLLDVDDHPVRKAARTRAPVKDVLVALECPGRSDRKWVLLSAEPLLDAGGNLHRLICTYHDVTERTRAEETLKESERKARQQWEELRLIYESAPIGLAVLDSDLRFLRVNERLAEINGVPAADHIGRTIREVVPALADQAEALLRSTFTTGRPLIDMELVGETAAQPGVERAWLERWLPIFDEDGRVEYLTVVVLEITDRKRAEDEIRDLTQRLSYHMDNSPLAVIEWGPDMRLTRWSGQAERVFGWTADEVLGKRIEDLRWVYDEDVAHVEQVSGELRTGADVQRFSLNRNYRKDGSVVWCEWHNSALVDESGRFRSILSLVLDVTERKKAEDARRQSEATLQGILDSATESIWLFTPDGVVLGGNEVALRRYGRTAAEVIGKQVSELGPADVTERRLACLRQVAESGRPVELEDMRAGMVFHHTFCPVLSDEGRVERVACFSRDMTEIKKTEQALRESEARHRALAEENARLYRQQLDIAESLQLALLNIPSELGPVRLGHLYRSATEAAQVGGDFYDAFEVKGGRLAILIGDVCGHGIEAARTATLVKDVVHAFVHESLRPHQVLRRTNALLVEKDLPGFVTLFMAVLDPATGVLRFASAGHPEGFLRRASGEIHMLGSGSSPLGIYPGATWKAGEVRLGLGDLLLFYTDGVIEARRNEELFGQKRLEKLLNRKRVTVERLPHLVLDQVLAFSGGTLSDDVAVLALSLTQEPTRTHPGFAQETLIG